MAVFCVVYDVDGDFGDGTCAPLVEALEELDSIRIHESCWLVAAKTRQFVFFEYIKSHSACCRTLTVLQLSVRPSLVDPAPPVTDWLAKHF